LKSQETMINSRRTSRNPILKSSHAVDWMMYSLS
jgi:hypothetical protein